MDYLLTDRDMETLRGVFMGVRVFMELGLFRPSEDMGVESGAIEELIERFERAATVALVAPFEVEEVD